MMGLTIYVLFRLAMLKLRLDVFDSDFRRWISDNNTLVLARILHEFHCALMIIDKFQLLVSIFQACREVQNVPLPVCRLISRHILADPA